MNLQLILVLLPVAVLLGWGGAFWVARQGQRVGLVDYPSARSSHRRPTPKGGGLGIMAATALTGGIIGIPWYAWLPAVWVAAFSLMADRSDISSAVRLKIHFVASLVFLFAQPIWSGENWYSWLWIAPWAIFIVGTANIYNFMDGINGIAGITGIIAFGLLSVYFARFRAESDLAMWYILLAAACAGFLPLNLPVARVFMGDVGSVLVGFLIASGIVFVSRSAADFLCAASFLFPFYADELTTMFIRVRDGEQLTIAHRRHAYQLLVNEMGYSHWKVAIGYGLVQAIVGGAALLMIDNGAMALVGLLSVCSGGFICFQACLRVRVAALWQRAKLD